MSALLRFACVAVPLWIVWTLLIAAAAPEPPGRIAQVVFAVTMLLGLAGSLWAGWSAFPALPGRMRRRWAAVAVGLSMFLVVVLVGHVLGVVVAARGW